MSIATYLDWQQHAVHVEQRVVQLIPKQTWQHSKKDNDNGVEKQDVGNADPNGQPAPPVIHRQVNGAHDAITQSLSCASIRVQLVLPMTCTQAMTSLSSDLTSVVSVSRHVQSQGTDFVILHVNDQTPRCAM